MNYQLQITSSFWFTHSSTPKPLLLTRGRVVGKEQENKCFVRLPQTFTYSSINCHTPPGGRSCLNWRSGGHYTRNSKEHFPDVPGKKIKMFFFCPI